MAAEQDLAASASDDDGEQLSGSGSDGSGSGYDSESSGEGNSGSGSGSGEEEEDDDDGLAEQQEIERRQRVRADVEAMRRMMADMDKVKMRLQFRFSAERQATLDRLAREKQERDEQEAARCKAEEEARSERVETSVQTDNDVLPLQMEQPKCSPDAVVAEDALPAATNSRVAADTPPPQKLRPAGLSLHDLVKASDLDVSRKAPPSRRDSPARRAEASVVLPARSSNETSKLQRKSTRGGAVLNERSVAKIRQCTVMDRGDGAVSGGESCSEDEYHGAVRHNSKVHSHTARASSMVLGSNKLSAAAPYQFHDENAAAISNSLFSEAGIGCVASSAHKRSNAELFNSARSMRSRVGAVDDGDDDDSKTDEQREMEAIQCLLFGR